MLTISVDEIERRLRGEGIQGQNASRLAQAVASEFKAVSGLAYENSADAEHALAEAVRAVLVMQARIRAATIRLPDHAPEKWEHRQGRPFEETPLEFMERVWGRYIRAGILYQNTIKRLGDPKLCRAVRNYCYKHQLDPARFLPPPSQAQVGRALKMAIPGSAEERRLQRRIKGREASKRQRDKLNIPLSQRSPAPR